MRMKTLALFLGLLLLSACSNTPYEEVARFSPGEITTLRGEFFIAEHQMELKAQDQLQVWIDLDYRYEGKQDLFFRFVILKDEKHLREFYVYPNRIEDLDVSFTDTDDSGITETRYFGHTGDFSVGEDGNYDFKVILMGSRNPSLEINKAELFLKMKGGEAS